MARPRDWFGLVFKSVAAAGIFACSLFLLGLYVPRLEVHFFPVVSKLQITELEPGRLEGSTRIKVFFEKFRDCEFGDMVWYLRDEDGQISRVKLDLRPDSNEPQGVTRPLGKQKSGPWEVGTGSLDLILHSFVLISHRCYRLMPWWVTRTEFYP